MRRSGSGRRGSGRRTLALATSTGIFIVSLGLLARFYLERLRLLLVPRLTSVLILVILLASVAAVAGVLWLAPKTYEATATDNVDGDIDVNMGRTSRRPVAGTVSQENYIVNVAYSTGVDAGKSVTKKEGSWCC